MQKLKHSKGLNMTIERDGTKVVIDTGSESDARQLAAVAKAKGIGEDGFVADVRRLYSKIDDFIQIQPLMGLVGFVLFILGAVMEFLSFSNLLPGKGVGFVLGCSGVAIYALTKLTAARLAVAVNNRNKAGQYGYGIAMVFGIVVCVGAASQLMASQIVNEDMGATTIRQEIDDLTLEINDQRAVVRQMQSDVSSLSAQDIEFEIDLLLSAPALNSQNQRTGQTVGEHVGDCIGDSWYQATYCDEIIQWRRQLGPRERYEEAVADLDVSRSRLEALRNSMPSVSGASALGSMFAEEGGQKWAEMIPGMLLMFFIIGLMLGATFLSKWVPPEEEVA